MNDTNSPMNENILPKLKTPVIFYFLSVGILFLITVIIIVYNDVNVVSFGKTSHSQQELIGNIFVILFFSLLVFSICIIFLPSLKEFKLLFEQIGSVTYVILYTISTILFYTMASKNMLTNYAYLINPLFYGLGGFSFYKATTENYMDKFNVNYERIKMLILIFCFITIIITFYNINPGGTVSKYFGYSLLLTIIISVFSFLYLIILLTMPNDEGRGQQNILSNFSTFGSYSSILFLVFLVIITIVIAINKDTFFQNKEKSGTIILLILITCILWTILLGANLFTTNAPSIDSSVFKKSLLVLFGLIISGLLIFWITYNIEHLSNSSSIISFILNLLVVIIILGLIYKTINVKIPVGNAKKNAFFNLLISILLYIPCLASNGFDWIGKLFVGQYNASEAGSFIMLFVAIILLVCYFNIFSVINLISTQGGKQLVNKPVYTNAVYTLGNYEDLNGKDNFDYQYAISCWIFIDASPPNMTEKYNKYTSLLNFGNKPNIMYKGDTNTLQITMQQKDLKDVTNNKLFDFDDEGNRILYTNKKVLLQKWNNIIVNYNGGTLDIFLNGELVKSSIEVVPYYTIDSLTIGENNGIHGGICNVIYFTHALSSNNIYYIYNSVKNKDPPTLNESNETILVKNINNTTNSMNTVFNK